jgi:CRISPR-associated protein Cst2
MNASAPIWEVAFLGRADLLFHSLNNEGSVGTSMRPRRLLMPVGDKLEERDGISGEMLKHGHVAYMHYLAVSEDRLPLCKGCRFLHPQRAAYQEGPHSEAPHSAYDAISRCAICDVHGFLVPGTEIHRDAAVQFAWAVSVTEAKPQSHQHARHDPFRGAGEGEAVQMPYQRPTRSGTYAVPCLLQLWRIGVDLLSEDASGFRAITDDQRTERAVAAIRALKALLLRPDGAMIATRLPHVTGVRGVLLVSSGPPLPMISPLNDGFIGVAEKIAGKGDISGIEVFRFNDSAELAERFDEVMGRIRDTGVGKPTLHSAGDAPGERGSEPRRAERTASARATTQRPRRGRRMKK